MNKRVRYICVCIFILSVFSLTIQASVINICKENKAFCKNQNQQNPVTEEEEESHDESIKELKYLNQTTFEFLGQNGVNFNWDKVQSNLPSNFKKISSPPPKQ